MIYVSRKEIEKEIELQELERERIEGSPIRTIKKVYKKRAYNKRDPKKRIKEKKEDKRTSSETQNLLLKIIKSSGSMNRKELMESTGIPWTTLFDNLNKLLMKKLLIKYPSHKGKQGRPIVRWRVTNN